MTPAEVLDASADLLDRDGWIRFSSFRDGKRCAWGAIMSVATGGDSDRLYISSMDPRRDLAEAARRHLADYMREHPNGWTNRSASGTVVSTMDITEWNDRHARDKRSVTRLLRRAAKWVTPTP